MKKSHHILQRIQKLKERYHRLAPEKKALVQLINETEIAEQVYNSNAIENSTLTLEETEKILLQIDLDRFVSERELFEAKNLARVMEYINITAVQKVFCLEMMTFLHKMLISHIQDEIAGRFRNKDEWVRVGNHIAPSPERVEALLKEMLVQYQVQDAGNIIKRISRLHLTFESIHPFVDGNGRIGRVMNNYLLIREGYVPINIAFLDRSTYYSAFVAFDREEKTDIMDNLVGLALCRSFHKRLAYLEDKKIISLRAYGKENGISHSNLINKAHRQTIEAFLEKGVWKIGI